MKRYKLLKDAPTIKAGTIFEEVVSDFDGLKALARITPVGAKTSPQFTINDIDNFGEWFEEIPENKRWRAEYGGEYAYIADDGSIFFGNDRRGRADNYRYRTGNYARAEDPVSLIEYKEYNIARRALLDDAEGGKYSYGEENWCTYYSKYTQEWTGFDNDIYHPGMIYFRTGEALKKSLKEHKEQWRIVCKYEMGEV